MLSYSEILDSLNYESLKYFKDPDLSYLKKYSSDFGLQDGLENIKIIHIAGTNGKGSTSSMIFSCLKKSSKKVGLFTSPHLSTIRERIQTNEGIISEESFAKLGNKVLDFTWELSYFEFCLFVAIEHFKNQKCDYIILETGLGGTYDATNIFDTDITCITSTSLDHQKILGNSLEKISENKAGIIKSNVPLFINFDNKIIFDRAKNVGAKIYFVDFDKETNLNGIHQKKNAGLAYSICEYLGLNDLKISTGLKNVEIKGRIQYLSKNLLIDGSHNEDSIDKLFDYLNSQNNFSEIELFFAVKKGKDLDLIISKIGNKNHRYIKVSNNMILGHEKVNLNSLTPEDIINESKNNPSKLYVVFGSLYVLQYFIDNKCLVKKLD